MLLSEDMVTLLRREDSWILIKVVEVVCQMLIVSTTKIGGKIMIAVKLVKLIHYYIFKNENNSLSSKYI